MTVTAPGKVRCRLTLFIVGSQANSLLAIENLRNICSEFSAGTCSVTIVDILEDFQAALDNNIFVTPTLLIEGPHGRSTVLGTLSEIDRIVLPVEDS